VAEILDNLAFQRLKRRSAKNKILQEKTLRQYRRWYTFVPVFHGLQGRSALKSRRREVLIIGQYITVHRRIKVFPWSKVMTLEDILYTPVESLNHAVCLRRLWWGQTMVDAEVAAQRVERHRQVVGDLRNDSRGARSQAALNSRVMSSQIQWASALVWR
jgi:hypothetical protein